MVEIAFAYKPKIAIPAISCKIKSAVATGEEGEGLKG
jgi:hypothetical protein